MFGYVRLHKPAIRMGEYEQYRGIYCTLCRRIGRRYGLLMRLTLSYDMTFLALSDRMTVDETLADGRRHDYLKPTEVAGFAWTERGIYRHGEKIFLQVILRDGTMRDTVLATTSYE